HQGGGRRGGGDGRGGVDRGVDAVVDLVGEDPLDVGVPEVALVRVGGVDGQVVPHRHRAVGTDRGAVGRADVNLDHERVADRGISYSGLEEDGPAGVRYRPGGGHDRRLEGLLDVGEDVGRPVATVAVVEVGVLVGEAVVDVVVVVQGQADLFEVVRAL